ncbi:MAG: hypothetical protein KAW17_09665 [Candidatus Eisenbacteria sp.]|nr:hypothetical protein [Candidatus Eisenbacteria bacterium]
MKTFISIWRVLKILSKSKLWPLVQELLAAIIYFSKYPKEEEARDRLFAAFMALAVAMLALYYSPATVGPVSYRSGKRVSASLTERIPEWQAMEDTGQATMDVAVVEFWRGLDEDDIWVRKVKPV